MDAKTFVENYSPQKEALGCEAFLRPLGLMSSTHTKEALRNKKEFVKALKDIDAQVKGMDDKVILNNYVAVTEALADLAPLFEATVSDVTNYEEKLGQIAYKLEKSIPEGENRPEAVKTLLETIRGAKSAMGDLEKSSAWMKRLEQAIVGGALVGGVTGTVAAAAALITAAIVVSVVIPEALVFVLPIGIGLGVGALLFLAMMTIAFLPPTLAGVYDDKAIGKLAQDFMTEVNSMKLSSFGGLTLQNGQFRVNFYIEKINYL